MNKSLLFLGSAMLAACATSPDPAERFIGDHDALVETVPGAPAEWAAQGVAGKAPTGDWLGQFNDPVMEALVAEALAANPTLESRAALTRASEALTRSARGARLPSLSGSATAGGTSTGVEVAGQDERLNDPIYGLGIDASWEMDLWGRVSNSIAQADADYAASEADLAATELSIAAQTAIAWIRLNEALEQERIALLSYEARDRVLTITDRRVRSGVAGPLELRTARSSLAGAEATIAARRQNSMEAARRLEVLLGRYPGAEITANGTLPQLTALEAQGNPALLLSRRPDIAALEARVVGAGLNAEAARLAMLPALRLTGSASTSSTELKDIVDPALVAARLVAGLSQPLFNNGRLKAQQDAAIAQAQAAVANYASGVLTAWREVEDALSADVLLAQQEAAQGISFEEARYAEELAERQYVSGTITIFNLIDAQTRRLTAESQLVTARASRGINRVSYHLALGGGVPVAAADTASNATDAEENGRSQ
ncbi:efflux transporter outer membrane subunit [Hyphomonas sp.]|uniref:efflux transporter outer membrane subunit n=1 Tax=Hyphomonas sp. TaxID=87 RepID=UPI0025C5F484|nr:efflux transporter outer membrane subunit [Hyphomonas sp.]MBI1398564.1 efflux transporter outer membrane subunit [Hyphomonas sp.]